MPNDCTNFITITFKEEEVINNFVKNELQHNIENKYVYNDTVNMIKRGCLGIVFEVLTSTNPPFEWLEKILHTYPNCWIKNEWCDESGMAGVWIAFINIENNEPIIQDFCWNDLSIEAKYYLFLDKNHED